jgi:hypothetical protein
MAEMSRKPMKGRTVIVLAKMQSGRFSELSGVVEGTSDGSWPLSKMEQK